MIGKRYFLIETIWQSIYQIDIYKYLINFPPYILF